MSKPIIELKNYSYRYDNTDEIMLKNLTLSINEGEFIGVVGCNWLKGDADGVLNNFSKLPVIVMRVARSTESIHPYVRPYQYYIATADYPLLRSVYIINTDPRSSSMLRNFYFFVKGQKGQTIICNNSQLLPITPVQVKSVSVK